MKNEDFEKLIKEMNYLSEKETLSYKINKKNKILRRVTNVMWVITIFALTVFPFLALYVADQLFYQFKYFGYISDISSYYAALVGIAFFLRSILRRSAFNGQIARNFSKIAVDGVTNGLGVNTSYEASKRAVSDIKEYMLIIPLCLLVGGAALISDNVSKYFSAWPFLALAAVLFLYKSSIIFRIKRGYYCNNAYELKEFIGYLQEKSSEGDDNFSGKALQEFKDSVLEEARFYPEGRTT